MTTARHIEGPATVPARRRTLRLATALIAAVALTPAAIADARGPQFGDGSTSTASTGQGAAAVRSEITGARCPCNAGLPVGTSGAAPTESAYPQVQRPGPGGPVGTLAASTAARCPCNAGLPIGTISAVSPPPLHPHVRREGPRGPVATLPAPQAAPVASAEAAGSDGFDWIDAAAGAGVVAVLGGLVLAAGRVRSRPLAG